MATITPRVIAEILRGDADAEIVAAFRARFDDQLERFAVGMSDAFEAWKQAAPTFTRDEKSAHISPLIYGALHTHVLSMKLFLLGLLVPAGNSARYVLESLAMAVLASKPGLGFLDRYSEGKYSTSKAIRDLGRYRKELNVNASAINQFDESSKLYDQHSHPTLLTLGSLFTFGDNPVAVLGGVFDPNKMVFYEKEIKRKVSLAGILPGIVHLVEENFRSVA